jgi:prevent-host-death family protein
METINIHEAKTHLSRLIQRAVDGEPFIIAKAGKPMVTVMAVQKEQPVGKRKLGFLKGKVKTPKDFKAFARAEMDEMFFGNPDKLIAGKRKR